LRVAEAKAAAKRKAKCRKANEPVTQWQTAAVCEWVRSIGPLFVSYAATFEANCVAGAALLLLNDGDLSALGVANPLHRKQLTAGVELLRKESGLPSAFSAEAKALVPPPAPAAAPASGAAAPQDGDDDVVIVTESSAPAVPASVSGDGTLCVVCLATRKSVMLEPCRHLCLCETCAADTRLGPRCPLCLTPYRSKRRGVFF
jgi:hypothetical protein